MASTIIQVNSGSGPKIAGDDYTDGTNTVIDQRVTPGEYKRASYSASATALLTTTANDHLMQLMAGSSLPVRVRRVTITQRTNAGALSVGEFALYRLTTAGTGGTAVTPSKYDNGDAASGATAQTLPSSKGTEGVLLFAATKILRAAADPGETPWVWEQHPSTKPIIIPAGTSNGIAVKSILGVATSTVDVVIEFVETPY
ncbi:MAG TPA: hypothetical protein VGQ89_14735 [Candidatus Limnocylindrales bacterium]|nr:hypothetical protein [Candidatus Limnocylindrales bacterium]